MLEITFAGFVASLAWIIIAVVLYMNPYVANIYHYQMSSPALKKWKNIPSFLMFQYIGMLLQSVLWAFVYYFVKPVLPPGIIMKIFLFGFIIFAVKIIPKLYELWEQSTYPDDLLVIEFINNTIGSFAIVSVFAFML